jgi:hypothetical protein
MHSTLLRQAITIILMAAAYPALSQADSTKAINHFGAATSVTNNGISLLPTFTLGKPAVIFDMNVGRKLTFEPQLRFSLEGQPWTFLFWWRYKLLKTNKFRINVGMHPAIAFRPRVAEMNGTQQDVMIAQRYLAGEFSPNYFLTKSISVGLYYLHSHGFAKQSTRSTHFITVNSNFSNIKLSKQFSLRVNPQLYYLRMDNIGGFYVTSTFVLTKKNFPLSVSSIINKVINTDITASKDFVWNVTLTYAFNKEYVKT